MVNDKQSATERKDDPPTSPTSPPPSMIELPLPIQPKDLVDPSIGTMITLWRAWPLDWSDIRQGMNLQKLAETLDGYSSKPITSDNIKLYRADQGQASRMMRLMILNNHWKNISLLDKSITSNITTPIDFVKKSKAVCQVVTMQDNVTIAIKLNEQATSEFESGNYGKSLTVYLQALSSLCPWSSDDSIMTFDQARNAGLSDIEQQILLNIIHAALAWSLLLPRNTKTKALCPILVDFTLQAFEFFPYTTYEGMIKLADLQHECMIRWPEHFTSERKRLFERRRACREFWRKQIPDEWAHRHCNLTHVCYPA